MCTCRPICVFSLSLLLLLPLFVVNLYSSRRMFQHRNVYYYSLLHILHITTSTETGQHTMGYTTLFWQSFSLLIPVFELSYDALKKDPIVGILQNQLKLQKQLKSILTTFKRSNTLFLLTFLGCTMTINNYKRCAKLLCHSSKTAWKLFVQFSRNGLIFLTYIIFTE